MKEKVFNFQCLYRNTKKSSIFEFQNFFCMFTETTKTEIAMPLNRFLIFLSLKSFFFFNRKVKFFFAGSDSPSIPLIIVWWQWMRYSQTLFTFVSPFLVFVSLLWLLIEKKVPTVWLTRTLFYTHKTIINLQFPSLIFFFQKKFLRLLCIFSIQCWFIFQFSSTAGFIFMYNGEIKLELNQSIVLF